MAAPTASSSVNLSNESATALTAVQMVQRILRRLEDDSYIDQNTNNLTSSGTAVTVATDATARYSAQGGDVLDWTDDGSFDAAVTTAAAATSLTVVRGHRGTTAAAHDGSVTPKTFRLNPRFLSHLINEMATEVIDNLYPDLFLVRDSIYTLPSQPYDLYYALPAGTIDILEVYQYNTTASPDTKDPVTSFTKPFWADTTNFTTGLGTRIEGFSDNGNIHVINVAKLALSTLNAAQNDIVAYETAANALEAEVTRPTRQGADAAMFDSTNKIQILRRRARELRQRERTRLLGFTPYRDSLVFRDRHLYSQQS